MSTTIDSKTRTAPTPKSQEYPLPDMKLEAVVIPVSPRLMMVHSFEDLSERPKWR